MARYFRVLRDYKSKRPEPRILHGYKAGQILIGRNEDGYTVDLYGATKSDLVFGSEPCEEYLSTTYSQTLHLSDVEEVEVVQVEQIVPGDTIYFEKATICNVGRYSDPCVPAEAAAYVDQNDGSSQPLRLSGKWHTTGLWFRQRDLEQTRIFRVKKISEEGVDATPEVVHTTEITVEGEVKAPKPRTKPIYEVQYNGQSVLKTKDRSKARRLKADLGGKEAGAIIMQYNAAKEIR